MYASAFPLSPNHGNSHFLAWLAQCWATIPPLPAVFILRQAVADALGTAHGLGAKKHFFTISPDMARQISPTFGYFFLLFLTFS
jgi:hypothetical protein